MSDLANAIAQHEAAEAVRPADRPIRVHTAVVMAPDNWRFVWNESHYPPLSDGPLGKDSERRRTFRLAECGDRLGLPVGWIVETREVVP